MKNIKKIKIIILILILFSCEKNINRTQVSKSANIIQNENINENKTSDNIKVVNNFCSDKIKIKEIIISSKEYYDTKNNETIIIYDTLNFIKNNNMYKLPLSNNKVKKIIDNLGVPYDEDIITYKYIGYLPDINKYILHERLYEDSNYLLIDKKTGKENIIAGIPFLSPNKEMIFAHSYNYYEEYSDIEPPTDDIFLYCFKNKSFLMYSKPNKWFINQCYWKDNTSIYLKIYKNENKPNNYEYLKLLLTN